MSIVRRRIERIETRIGPAPQPDDYVVDFGSGTVGRFSRENIQRLLQWLDSRKKRGDA